MWVKSRPSPPFGLLRSWGARGGVPARDSPRGPLLASEHDFVAENFYSAARAVRDHRMFDNEGWAHPPGSALIGWTREVGRSRIVYLQCGDGPVAYANPQFRQLLGNAIRWVAESR